jgi:hypothetical protein
LHLAEARNNNNHPGHLKQNFECFSIDWCRCNVRSTPHLFSVSFWNCKVLLCPPYTTLVSRRIWTVNTHVCPTITALTVTEILLIVGILCTVGL